jgi:tetratricopeptide (TPR) repeat protein/tRNA A-37 threonylcarbamoyl transferase component Bud32
MRPASDISGQQTLPGEILPTDKTVVADGRPRPQVPLPVGPFRVGRFTAVRQIGAGGMGVVYMAYDEQLDRKVAVKLLQERPGADAESLGHARLLREAQAMAHVSHPNVAAVYEVGTYEDQVFVAMELVEGKTLGQWLADEPRSWQEIVAVYVQAGRGLAAAHAAGLVHRDFKPENVIVGDDGRARVLDFGLARASRDVPTLPPAEISGTDLRLNTSLAVQLTQAGSLLGTPAYMPPEQYLRAGIDARSDQFSFCVALFEALYGARPFTGQTLAELMAAITRGKVRVPKQHRPVPGWIHEVVVRGLHVDADRRWPDMPTLLEALGRDPARRRRRVALRVGAALLLGATVFAVLKARELQAQVCTGAAAQLGDVWSEARADEVRAALRASGLPYAPAAAERVVASLDDYADEWIAARTRACEATAVRQEQSQELLDRRMACLDERRAGLRALVGVLVAADAAVVEKAVQVTSELPRLEPCSDSAYLQARVRPPDDPAAALRVEATRAQLSQARTLMLAGKFAGAGRLVEEALAAAATLGYGPLVAEVELMHGELRTHEGSYTDAEAALRRAYVAARTAGDGEVAAAAATALVGVTGHSLARFEAGALWREVAAAEVARSGDPLAPADLARETASMAVREGDYVRAQAAYLRGLALREAVVGAEHSSLIGELNQLGAVLEKQGKYAEAGEHIRRALALCEATLGPEHPLVATTADNLGAIFQAEGRYEDALAQHLRGLQIRERLLGPEHLQVADSLNSLGIVAESLGRPSETEAYFRREISIREQHLGPDNPAVALSHTNLGAILHIHGDDDGALLHLRRALEIQEKVLPPDHPETVFVLANLGLVARAQGRLGDALDDLGRALRVVERSSGPEHVNAASIRQNLGSVLQQLGRSDEALAELQRALAIRELALGPTHPDVATLRANIGTILALQGKTREAAPVLRRSLADLEAALGPTHPDLADSLLGLCELGLKTADPSAALLAAERALRLRGAGAPNDLAAARFAVARALVASGGDRLRALELAQAARLALPPASGELPAIDRWLARHRPG